MLARAELEDLEAVRAAELDTRREDTVQDAYAFTLGAVVIAALAIGAFATYEGRRLHRLLGEQNRAVKQARAEAEHRAQMVNLASHELRNPLAVMSLASELVRELATDTGDQILVEAAEDAFNASRRAEANVSELLDLSRIDAGQLRLDLKTTAVRSAVDQALAVTKSHRGERPVEVSGTANASVLADPGRLQIIVRNLIDNAFKYSPPETPVRVDVSQAERSVLVDVRDSGPGIPSSDRERVFSRFERLEATSHVGGIGIGLNLSRDLARRMGGDMLACESDGGAWLRLVLPTSEVAPGEAAA